MGQPNRLGLLEVRVPGQENLHRLLCPIEKDLVQPKDLPPDFIDDLPQIQTHVESHLIVPAARGVELSSHVTDLLDEPRLDIHVDVLELRGKLEPSRPDLPGDFSQPFLDALRVPWRENPLMGKHPRVGNASQDILPEQPLIERDRLGEPLHLGRRLLPETAGPAFFFGRPPGLFFGSRFFTVPSFRGESFTPAPGSESSSARPVDE